MPTGAATVASPATTAPSGPRARPRSAQARTQARSYVVPDGRMTGSAIGKRRIGHRNSACTSSSLLGGVDGVASTSRTLLGLGRGGFGAGEERNGRSCFQRRAAPIRVAAAGRLIWKRKAAARRCRFC